MLMTILARYNENSLGFEWLHVFMPRKTCGVVVWIHCLFYSLVSNKFCAAGKIWNLSQMSNIQFLCEIVFRCQESWKILNNIYRFRKYLTDARFFRINYNVHKTNHELVV
jgi:hypothetical protein